MVWLVLMMPSGQWCMHAAKCDATPIITYQYSVQVCAVKHGPQHRTPSFQ
jgi:hypothetical protein